MYMRVHGGPREGLQRGQKDHDSRVVRSDKRDTCIRIHGGLQGVDNTWTTHTLRKARIQAGCQPTPPSSRSAPVKRKERIQRIDLGGWIWTVVDTEDTNKSYAYLGSLEPLTRATSILYEFPSSASRPFSLSRRITSPNDRSTTHRRLLDENLV